MRTDFAEIDALATATLDRQHASPTVPPVFKFVAGFQLPDLKLHDRLVGDRRGEIDTFRQQRQKLIEAFAEHEVTPLAVIPKTMWHRICRESRLYRFKPDSEGKIRVDTRDAIYFDITAGLLGLALWLAPIVAFAYVACAMHWPGTPTLLNWAMVVGLIGTVISYIVMASKFQFRPFIDVHVVLGGMMARLYDLTPHEWRLHRMLPDMRGLSDKGTKTRLILPPMPDDVAAIVERAALTNYTLRVAVVPQGFCFESPASDLFVKTFVNNAHERAWRMKQRAHAVGHFFAHLDPIIYITSGNVVAIVAQFGEFPIEREAVMKAIDAEYAALGAA